MADTKLCVSPPAVDHAIVAFACVCEAVLLGEEDGDADKLPLAVADSDDVGVRDCDEEGVLVWFWGVHSASLSVPGTQVVPLL